MAFRPEATEGFLEKVRAELFCKVNNYSKTNSVPTYIERIKRKDPII